MERKRGAADRVREGKKIEIEKQRDGGKVYS
jgi:hypothetical protein